MFWTYLDTIDQLTDFEGSDPGGRTSRLAKGAARDAHRELVNVTRWVYYQTTGRIVTQPIYDTGTVVYTDSTRQVTLTDGIWPDWTAKGVLRIGEIPYTISSRDSDTVLTLDLKSNPGQDVASTTYQLYQDAYQLPEDMVQVEDLISFSNNWTLNYISPREWSQNRRLQRFASTPAFFTVMGDPKYQNTLSMYFSPPPSSLFEIDFLYRRRPRELKVDQVDAGTVTVSGTTVTGTGTAFTDDLIGCSIRFGANARDSVDGLEGAKPAAYEAVVSDVTNATSLTIDTSLTISSAVKYVVSDIVDIDQGVMLNAFRRGCEYHMAKRMREKNAESLRADWMFELRVAMGADNKVDTGESPLTSGYGLPMVGSTPLWWRNANN